MLQRDITKGPPAYEGRPRSCFAVHIWIIFGQNEDRIATILGQDVDRMLTMFGLDLNHTWTIFARRLDHACKLNIAENPIDF
jgi:hypothetical protein